MAKETPPPIWYAVLICKSHLASWTTGTHWTWDKLTMPPHRLFTFIGALINMRVLQVMYAIETPVMLKNEVGITLTQLDSDIRTCTAHRSDFVSKLGK